MKVKLAYQVVYLVRGEGSKTPLTVLPHEVEILKQMHGEDSIQETDIEPPVKDVEFDTADEFARLEQYYRGHSELPNPTRAVFRNIEEFEAAFESVGAAGSALTAAQIKEKLTALGVEFPSRASKQQLEALLAEHEEAVE